MKRILLLLGVVAMFSSMSIAQTSLQGKVTDVASNEPILFGTVALMKDGAIVKGVETDLDGNYYFSDINPGTYDVEASYVGYTPSRLTGVLVKADKSNKLDLQISEGVLADEIVITEYKVPLIEFDNTSTGGIVTSEDIASLPTKNVNAIAAQTAGIASQDGGDISIRGARESGTVYFIDGVRVTNAALIPQSEIDQLQVITGGIEAKYGDVTGGLISLTTKGPSQNYSGGFEAETSELTDAYGYNLLSANVGGPLLKREDGKSILGFRFSGQFIQIDDNSPSAVGVYRASEEDIAFYENDPLYFIGTSPRPSTEQFGDPNGRQAQLLDARPNSQNTDLDITAKIDALITDNMDVTLSTSYYDRSNFFSPDGAWTMFNWQNNPESRRNGYRGSFRFRHKIGQQANDPTLTEEEKAELGKATFRNLSYTVQLGVEKDKRGQEDIRFEDRLFEYGYYGEQVRSWQAIESLISDPEAWDGEVIPVVNFVGDTIQRWAHQGSRELVEEFIPGSINPVLAQFNSVNGLPEPEFRNTYNNLYSNVGREYNTFFRSEQDVYNGQVTVSFDLTPGGSEKGRHNIQMGLALEQRVNRQFNIAPRDLWLAARVNANNHISGVNTDVVIGSFASTEFTGGDTIFTQYQNAIQSNEDAKFFRSVRGLLNDTPLEQFVNIDAINPNDLTLDMFSARELNDERIINYYGYDYTGEKLSGDVSFDDFFTSRDEDGLRDFKIGANTPIYGFGYIQDKFAYKDIIFKVGVRMDYFDANTKVLKDNFSLYDIKTASEFFADNPAAQPGAVGDDYKVYVAGEGSEDVVAYRQGDVWFQPNGTATSPALLFEGAATPAYAAGDDLRTIREEGFNVDGSFEDYTPQINFMPRLAFSFPISDDAGFFAHYDVLYQRPTSNNIQTPLNYFNLGSGDLVNNPNLKPVRTVDYEVGYKQKLTNSSAMTLSAYYREQRDMIQRRIFTNVPSPIFQYETFDNLDFGTVKGFSFTYDRRRVGNIKLTATYTLQFADGSGSDANSSGGINSRGPIRNLIPLSYDERHRITSTIDYRYGSGKRYTGPRIGGVDIFENTGLNLIVNAVSGRPYTKRRTVQQFGGVGFEGAINGARLPWNTTIDARLDRSFDIGGGEGGGRPLSFNVYLRVQNLLDARNIFGVYPVTGSAEDDGFIISSFGQDRLSQINNNGQSEEVFLAQYNYRLLSPGFFSLARRIYIGALVNF